MKKFLLSFFILLIIQISYLTADAVVDSLSNELNNVSGQEKFDLLYNISQRYMNLADQVTIKKSLKNAIDYADSINYRYGYGVALSAYAYTLTTEDKFDASIDTFNLSIQVFESINKPTEVAYSLNQIGRIYGILSKNDTAMEYFVRAFNSLPKDMLSEIENIYKQNSGNIADTVKREASIYSIITTDYGLFLFNIDEDNEALHYFELSLKMGEITNNKMRISGSLSNMGMVYESSDNLDMALEYYNKALKISKEIDFIPYLGAIYINLGHIFRKQEEFQKAEDSYIQALHYNTKMSRIEGMIASEYSLALARIALKNFPEAYKNLNNAYLAAKDNQRLQYMIMINEAFSDYYVAIGDYRNAYLSYKEFKIISDSLSNEERIANLDKLKIEFDTENKLNKIEILEDLNQQQAKTRQFLIIIIGLSVIFVGFLIFGLYDKTRLNNKLKAVNDELIQSNQKLTESAEELRELNLTKDKFFSIISHDLKNPLSAIMSLSELLSNEMDNFSLDELKASMHELKTTSKHLFSLLQNLLNWSRTQLGQLHLHYDNVNLNQIIQNTTDLLNNQAKLKNISIINETPKEINISTDMNVLATILRNFVSNAIKFSHNGSQIKIHTFTQNGSAKISITDSGIGISDEDKGKLFNLAVKFSTYGTAKEKGTGLGLILVKELAEKIDGKLEVESRLDVGSTFSIILPLKQSN